MTGVRIRLGLAAAAGVGAAGCAVGLTVTAAWLISRAAERPPILLLMVAIVAVRAFGLGRGVLRYLERLLAHDAAFRIQTGQRVEIYRRLAAEPADGRDPRPPLRRGDLVSRLVADVDSGLERLVRVVLPLTVAGVVGAATAALLAVLLPVAGAATAIAVGLTLLVVPRMVATVARSAERRLVPLRAELSVAVAESLDALPELVVYGGVERAERRIADIDRRLRTAEARSAWGAGLGAASLTVLVGGAVLTGLWFGVGGVTAGQSSHILLAVVTLTPLALADVLASVPAAAAVADRLRPARERVARLLAEPPAEPEPDEPGSVSATIGPPYVLRAESIRAETIAGGRFGVDLELGPGARVAVVGPSGSGKTTLIETLVRLRPLEAGMVRLNGIDIRKAGVDELRRVVKVCEQDPYIFDTTVAENLRLARPDASEEELRRALRKAGLLDWVDSLPARMETALGEHGERMSGGQRQRLGLARCLLADPPIMLYDEPTEHVDAAAADRLIADLLAASAGRAVLIAAHRPIPPGLVGHTIRLG